MNIDWHQKQGQKTDVITFSHISLLTEGTLKKRSERLLLRFHGKRAVYVSQGQRVRGQQDASRLFRPLFCRGKERMEDEKDWIGCAEVGGERGKTRMGGGVCVTADRCMLG